MIAVKSFFSTLTSRSLSSFVSFMFCFMCCTAFCRRVIWQWKEYTINEPLKTMKSVSYNSSPSTHLNLDSDQGLKWLITWELGHFLDAPPKQKTSIVVLNSAFFNQEYCCNPVQDTNLLKVTLKATDRGHTSTQNSDSKVRFTPTFVQQAHHHVLSSRYNIIPRDLSLSTFQHTVV